MSIPPEPHREASLPSLIGLLAHIEPPFSSLGVAFLVDTDVTSELVRRGAEAGPALTAALSSPNTRTVAYAAYCLGQIGDPAALPPLRQARRRLESAPPVEHDFTAISAVAQAEERLTEA
jgi:HEAT repeat protein